MSPLENEDEDQKYYDAFDQDTESLRLNAYSLNETQPADKTARALELAQKKGVPRVAIESDLEGYEAEDQSNRLKQLRETAPKTYKWLSQTPDNYAVAKDDVKELGAIEKSIQGPSKSAMDIASNGLKWAWYESIKRGAWVARNPQEAAYEVGDLGRSAASALPQMLGSTAAGAGEIYNADMLLLERALKNVPGIKQAYDFEARLRSERPGTDEFIKKYASPGDALKAVGSGYKDIQHAWEPDKMGFEDQVASAVGQMAAAILARNPSLMAGAYTMMGVDTQAESMRAAGIDPSMRPLELTTGGAITGLSEKMRLDSMMKILPPSMRAKVGSYILARIGGQAAEEGLQEGIENLTQNLLTTTYDPNAEILSGVGEAVGVAGTSAAILQGIVELALPGKRRRGSVDQMLNEMNTDGVTPSQKGLGAFFDSVGKMKMKSHSPEKMTEAFSEILKDSGLETTTVDVNALGQALQQGGATEEQIAEVMAAMGVTEDAKNPFGQVQVPTAKLAASQTVLDNRKVIEQHIFAGEDGTTPAQRVQAEGNVVEAMQKQIADAIERGQAVIDFEEQITPIRERIAEDVKSTGVYKGKQLERVTTIVQSLFEHAAVSSGQTNLVEFYNKQFPKMGTRGPLAEGEEMDPDVLGSSETIDPVTERVNGERIRFFDADPEIQARAKEKAGKLAGGNLSAQDYLNEPGFWEALKLEILKEKMKANKEAYDKAETQEEKDALWDEFDVLKKELPAEEARQLAVIKQEQAERKARDAAKGSSSDVLPQAQEAGYQGTDTGEARQWLAAKAKGLDMSVEGVKARAKELGFDTETVYYRGMTRPVEGDSFTVNQGDWGPGVYVGNAGTASSYSNSIMEGAAPTVYPLYIRGKMMDVADYQDLQDAVRKSMTPAQRKAEGAKNAIDLEAQRRAKEAGFVGVEQFRAVYDGKSTTGSALVFDPSNIRSVNAAFDPDQSGSADLLAQLIGPKAKGADKAILKTAQKMAKEKVKNAKGKKVPKYTRQQIWDETAKLGQPWYQDDNGDWISEIEDGAIVVREIKGKLSEVVEMPSIYAQYPELAKQTADARDKVKVREEGGKDAPGTLGAYTKYPFLMGVNLRISDRSKQGQPYTATHEIQHAVDEIEDREMGRRKPYYQRDTERRAFNTMYRMLWSMEERIATPPWKTEDMAVRWWSGLRDSSAEPAKFVKPGTLDPGPTVKPPENLDPKNVPDQNVPDGARERNLAMPDERIEIGGRVWVSNIYGKQGSESNRGRAGINPAAIMGRTFLSIRDLMRSAAKNERVASVLLDEAPATEGEYVYADAYPAGTTGYFTLRTKVKIGDSEHSLAMVGETSKQAEARLRAAVQAMGATLEEADVMRIALIRVDDRAVVDVVLKSLEQMIKHRPDLIKGQDVGRLRDMARTMTAGMGEPETLQRSYTPPRTKAEEAKEAKRLEGALADKLLDMDAQLSEQPAAVRAVLEAMIAHEQTRPDLVRSEYAQTKPGYFDGMTVNQLLEELAQSMMDEDGSSYWPGDTIQTGMQALIQQLRAAGVVGGKYLPGGVNTAEDAPPQTQSIVIFDERAPVLLTDQAGNLMQREQDERRGQYNTETRQLDMFEAADITTMMHEMAHWYLDFMEKQVAAGSANPFIMAQLAQVDSWYQGHRNSPAMQRKRAEYNVREDFGRFVLYRGAERIEGFATPEEAEAKIDWIERQEAFAETFEVYLQTGKSPSEKMRSVFADFAKWISSLWKKMYPAGSPDRANLNPEIVGVMDRMLASEEEINAMREHLDATTGTLARKLLEDGHLTQKQYDKAVATLEKALEAVKEEVRTRVIKAQMREREEWWQTERRAKEIQAIRTLERTAAARAASWLSGQGYKGDVAPDTSVDRDGDVVGQDIETFETPGSPEWEAAKAKGLDMSQAGRMARAKEMGFDTETVLYHGTNRDFDAFSAENMGRTDEGGSMYGTGHYFATTPDAAEFYAKNTVEKFGGAVNTVPAYVRLKNPLTADMLNRASVFADFKAAGYSMDRFPNGYMLKSQSADFAKASAQFTEIAQKLGYDGVVTRDQVNVFDASNIRSVNAAFDPDNAQSANLLAQSIRAATRMPMEEVGEWVLDKVTSNFQDYSNGDESAMMTWNLTDEPDSPQVLMSIRLSRKGRADVNLFLDNKMADALEDVKDINERRRLASDMFAQAVLVMRKYASETPELKAFNFIAAENKATAVKKKVTRSKAEESKSREELYRLLLSTLQMDGYTAYEVTGQMSVVYENAGEKSARPYFTPGSSFVLIKDGVDPNEFARSDILRGSTSRQDGGEVVTVLKAVQLTRPARGGVDGRGREAGRPDPGGAVGQPIAGSGTTLGQPVVKTASLAKPETLGLTPEQVDRVNPIYRPEVLPTKKMKTNKQAAAWLEGIFSGDPVTDFTIELTEEQIDEISNVMVAEAMLALQKTGNASDWYSEAMLRTIAIASIKYPMLRDDAAAELAGFGSAANARFVFTFIKAITSQNLNVDANVTATDKIFAEMVTRVAAGEYSMPARWGTGDKQKAMGLNFEKFEKLIDAMPGGENGFPAKLAALDEMFRKSMTVSEWEKFAKAEGIPFKAPGQTAKDAVVYGSSVLGPKIGNGFWQNLNGNFSPLTIDLWMRRTWGRLTGKSIGNPGALPGQRRRLAASIKRSRSRDQGDPDQIAAVEAHISALRQQIEGLKQEDFPNKKAFDAEKRRLKADLDSSIETFADISNIKAPEAWKSEYNKSDEALLAYAKRLLKVWDVEYKRLRGPDKKPVPAELQPTWARAAKTIITNLAKPLDQVNNGTQRIQIERAVTQALAKLSERGINLTTADLQAILWYPEKELWGALTDELNVDEDGVPIVEPSELNESYDTVWSRKLKEQGYEVPETEDDRSGRAVAGQDAGPGRSQDAGRTGPSGAALDGRKGSQGRGGILGQDPPTNGAGVRRTPGGSATFGGRVSATKFVFGEGSQRPVYEVTDPDLFRELIVEAKASLGTIGAQVTVYDDYAGKRLFLFDDGASGFALDGDDIISVFSIPGKTPKGAAKRALEIAVTEGGKRLDAFDTFLPGLYARSGFRAVARLGFSREYAPPGWDYDFFAEAFPQTSGEPHVVFMIYDPANAGAETDNIVSDYDAGLAAQAEAARVPEAARALGQPRGPRDPRGWGQVAPPPEWTPMRLDLEAIKTLHPDFDIKSLPKAVLDHSRNKSAVDEIFDTVLATAATLKTSVEEGGPDYEANRQFAEEQQAYFEGMGIDINAPKGKLRAAIAEAFADASVDLVTPDQAAEQLGFNSGDELLNALANMSKRSEIIKQMTDMAMAEAHGDPFTDGTFEEEARQAAEKEVKFQAAEIEFEAITRALGVSANKRAIKEAAERAVSIMSVKELSRWERHLDHERRETRNAMAAVNKGDMAAAMKHKRMQMTHMYMARAMREKMEAAEKLRVHLLTYEKSEHKRKQLAKAGDDYLDQMDALLHRYHLRKDGAAKIRRAAEKAPLEALHVWALAEVAAMDPLQERAEVATEENSAVIEGADPMAGLETVGISKQLETEAYLAKVREVEALAEEASRVSYETLTVEEFEQVGEQADMIYNLARAKRHLLASHKNMLLETAVEEIEASILDNKKKNAKQEQLETSLPEEERRRNIQTHLEEHRTLLSYFRQMDGGKDGGPMQMLLSAAMSKAFGDRAAVWREMEEGLADLFSVYEGADRKGLFGKKVFVPGPDISMTKQGILSVALNMGTEKNRKRMMDSEGWSEADLFKIVDSLDQRDWQFVQSAWALMGKYFQPAQEVHTRVHGIPMERVEPIEVATKFGVIPGGYYPIVFDTIRSPKADQRALANNAKTATTGLGVSSRSGYTRKRSEGKITTPIHYSILDVMVRHLSKVADDITIKEPMIDVGRIITHPDIEAAITLKYGSVVYKQITSTLLEIKNGQQVANSMTEKILIGLRHGATTVGLGWRFSTALLQVAGLTNSMSRVGSYWIARGVIRTGTSAFSRENAAKFSIERSSMMANRARSQQREISELRNKFKDDLTPTWLKESFFWMITTTQMHAVDVPTWIGQYEKAISKGATEVEAALQADLAVQEAQGTGEAYGLAAIQRGTPLLKLFTNFMSYMITTMNMAVQKTSNTNFKDPREIAALSLDMMALMIWPVISKMVFDAVLKGAVPDDDDEETWATLYAKNQLSFLMSMSFFPAQLSGAVTGFGYDGPVGTSAFKSITDAIDGKGDWTRPALASAGAIFKMPTGQLDTTMRGWQGIADGHSDDYTDVIFGPDQETREAMQKDAAREKRRQERMN